MPRVLHIVAINTLLREPRAWIIGASLSEPHINGKPMRKPYIYLYRGTSVISIAHYCIRSPADVRNNSPCAMTYAAEKRAWTLPLV